MKQLIFVYNANSVRISAALDFLHKIFRPSTYQCNLCAITYGYFGIREEWNIFLRDLTLETVFLHKDEFLEKFPDFKTDFPVAILNDDYSLTECISSEEMNRFNLELLMGKVRAIIEENEAV